MCNECPVSQPVNRVDVSARTVSTHTHTKLTPKGWAELHRDENELLSTLGKLERLQLNKMVITHFPPFRVLSPPKSSFPHEKSIFPICIITKKRHLSFSAIFRPTQILNDSNFYYYIEYSACGGNLTWRNFILKMGDHRIK